jgi:hypothetical protein
MAKKNTRPALVQPCGSTEDHAKHPYVPEFGKDWPEGVFWFCHGYNRAEAVAGVKATARLVKKASKKKGH